MNDKLDGLACQLWIYKKTGSYQIGLFKQNLYDGGGVLLKIISIDSLYILIETKGGSQTRYNVPIFVRSIYVRLSLITEIPQTRPRMINQQMTFYCGTCNFNQKNLATLFCTDQTFQVFNNQALIIWEQLKQHIQSFGVSLSPNQVLSAKYKQNDCLTYKYCGELQNQPSGFGMEIQKYCNYEGYFKNGIKHGFAIIQQKDGSICSSFWHEGKPIYAIIQYHTKEQYKGQVQEQFRPHGKGIMYTSKETTQGIWVQGKLYKGWIEYTFDGTRIKVWRENGIITKGSIKEQNGYIYEGQLSVRNNGLIKEGLGTELLLGQFNYKGSFKNNLRDGYGILEASEGKFEAFFKEGKLFKLIKSSVYLNNGMIVKYLHFDDVTYLISVTMPGYYQYVGQLDATGDCRHGYGTTISYFNKTQSWQDSSHLTQERYLRMKKKVECQLTPFTELSIIYSGDYKNDIEEGFGVMQTLSIKYVGIWQSLEVFYGTISINDIVFYQGERISFDGWNKYIAPNGDIYQGYWIQGILFVGSHSEHQNMRVYQGQYKFRKPDGQGMLTWYVKGEYYRNQLLKLFKYGRVSDANCLRDILESKQYVASENEQLYKYQYKGGFSNGQLCGVGVLTFNQIKYQGGFLDNRLHGNGLLIDNNQISTQSWYKGTLQRQEFNDQSSISYQSGEPYYIEQ